VRWRLIRTNTNVSPATKTAHAIQAEKFDRSSSAFIPIIETATSTAIPAVRAQPSHVTGVAP